MAISKSVAQKQVSSLESAKLMGNNLARLVFGENGPSTDVCLDDIEQTLDPIVKAMVGAFLTTSVETQAGRLKESLKCPTCEQPCTRQERSSKITAVQGKLSWEEPVYHCDDCQRSFFPSEVDAQD